MTTEDKSRAASSRSNFYYSFLFLPRDQRDAIQKVYHFCRIVDDIVDEDRPDEEKITLIANWREELDRCYEGHPSHPVTQSLLGPISAFGLSREHFEDLIRGVETDLRASRYETIDELLRYCYGVAGCVGLLCLEIFGVPVSRYRDYAISLGAAFQLTNILRDLKADAERGRIYLPLEELRRFGYSEAELLGSVYNDSFRKLMEFQYERTRSFYQRAAAMVKPEDRKRMVASEIMASIYASILDRIRESGYRVFDQTISLPPHRKFLTALRARFIPAFARVDSAR
jgi:15-cis-phytoene synthase